MIAKAEQNFLARVRTALGHDAHIRRDVPLCPNNAETQEMEQVLETIHSRTHEERLKLLEDLIRAGQAIKLSVIAKPDPASAASAIAQIAQEKAPEWTAQKWVAAWQDPLIDQLDLRHVLGAEGMEVDFGLGQDEKTGTGSPRPMDQAHMGITSADYCVSDTGTLVMKTRAGQARSISLLPSIHIAVIELHRILASFKELYTLLSFDPEHKAEGLTNCMTFITGPSKTADIEAQMVHGVHGPREVYLFVITG